MPRIRVELRTISRPLSHRGRAGVRAWPRARPGATVRPKATATAKAARRGRTMPRIRFVIPAMALAALLPGLEPRLKAQTDAPQAKEETHSNTSVKTREKPEQEKARPNPKSKAARARNSNAQVDPPGFYMGRQIADVMSWEGVDWLFRETRIEEEQPEAMLDALKIEKGASVADVGAGAGYHSLRLAKRVGPRGTVFATDLQPEMLRMLQRNARQAKATNIK